MSKAACLCVGVILVCIGLANIDGVSLLIGIGCVGVSTLALVTGA